MANKQSFYFYDLETTGVSPRSSRIMQFAGQRTGLDLKPVGDPHNVLIRLTDDILPDPDAILVTGITPQQTKADGISEAEFLKLFAAEISVPDTIFVGFNNVRFDDEFMRFLQYRNFYDAYEWQYKDGRGRWDLLDVTRMLRALRPDGIKWPVDSKGNATNRLQLLTDSNGLDHRHAHDAMSDVEATISWARLIQQRQPKLFKFLLELREKPAVAKVVKSGQPFVYSSGKYPSEFEKTTIVSVLADHPVRKDAVLVYDLRHDPEPFLQMTDSQLMEAWRWQPDETAVRLPVKTLQFNRCPAVAPLSVLDDASQQRIQLTPQKARENLATLTNSNLAAKVLKVLETMNQQQQTRLLEHEQSVDEQLYDGFIGDGDKQAQRTVQAADAKAIKDLKPQFKDERLKLLFPLFKARNYPRSLSSDERAQWEHFCSQRLLGGKPSRAEKFFQRLGELAEMPGMTPEKQFLLEELQLYGQSILPLADYE